MGVGGWGGGWYKLMGSGGWGCKTDVKCGMHEDRKMETTCMESYKLFGSLYMASLTCTMSSFGYSE